MNGTWKIKLSLVATFFCAMLTFSNAQVTLSNGLSGMQNKTCIKALASIEKDIFRGRPYRTLPNFHPKNPVAHSATVIMVVDYNGTDSNITLTSVFNKDTGKCDINYTETYSFKTSCMAIREEGFSKWNFVGKLNKTTVLHYRRDKDLMAFLTPQGVGVDCLISKRKVYWDK